MRERRPFRMQFPVAIVATTLLVTVRRSRYAAARPPSSDSDGARFFWSTPVLIETFVETAPPRPRGATGLLDEMSGSTRRSRDPGGAVGRCGAARARSGRGRAPRLSSGEDRTGPAGPYRLRRTLTAALGPCNRSAKPVCGSPAPVVGQRRGPVLLVDPRADRDLRGDRAASAAGCNRAAGRDVRLYAAISRPGRCCRALRGRESEKRERPCTKVVERGRSHWPRRPIPASPNAYRTLRTLGPGGPADRADRPTGGPGDRRTGRPPACLRRGSRPPSRGDSGRHQLGTNRSRARGSGRKRRSARGGGERSSRRALNRNKGCVREARRRKQTDQKADGEEAEAWEDIEGSRTIRWGHGRRTGRRRRARTTRCAARRRR